MHDRNGRVFLATSAQVVAVGINLHGPVLGGADESLGLVDACLAFDRVQCEVQAGDPQVRRALLKIEKETATCRFARLAIPRAAQLA